MDGPFPPPETGDSYYQQSAEFRPGPFMRRPTNLSQKAGKKASRHGDDGTGGYVNLEGGLAITLNLELNPRDPSGITTPYKMLVPMLRYEGTEYDPPATPVAKGWRKWLGVRRKKADRHAVVEDTEAELSDEELEDEEDDFDDYDHRGGKGAAVGSGGRSGGRDYYDGAGMPPETLVPVGAGGAEDEDGVRAAPRRKKWFGLA